MIITCLSELQMNILLADSRGGGLKSRIPKEHRGQVMSRVYPGARINFLTTKAEKMLNTRRHVTQDTHIYIMGGINDITHKHSSWQYTEVTYTEKSEDTIQRVINDLENCATTIKEKGATPIFCTITSSDITKYNHHMLKKRWTRTLRHENQYTNMQTELEKTIIAINAHIVTMNQLI